MELTEEEAQLDGFESLEECLQWFKETHKITPELLPFFELFIMEWKEIGEN